jgi:precorrin-3B synthase
LDSPRQSGDGLLVRVRPRGALSAAAARALAAAASAFGNGVVELTQRASLQVRGLRPETLAPFAAAMVAQGLTAPGAVMRAPLGEADALAGAIESSLARVAGLPQKFLVTVDAGGPLPLGDVGADVRIVGDDTSVMIGLGQAGPSIRCAPDEAARAVASLASAFMDLSALRVPAPRRMRTLVADVGARAVFAAAGLTADAESHPAPSPVAVGRIAGAAFGLGLPFGAFDGDALADLAERHGDGSLRLTPWRAVVVSAVTAPDALAAEAAQNFIVSAGDPRRRVFACPGAPACASATVATRPAALAWAALGRTCDVHVSGCEKGCAHPGPAAITLVGGGGRYSLVRDGRAGDAPELGDLSLADAMAAA